MQENYFLSQGRRIKKALLQHRASELTARLTTLISITDVTSYRSEVVVSTKSYSCAINVDINCILKIDMVELVTHLKIKPKFRNL